MDFKTKCKIIIMRKFEHTDLAMLGGAVTIIGLIVFSILTQGTGDGGVLLL